MTLPAADVALVEKFCADASPAEFAEESRVECVIDGSSLTIVEASRLNAERAEDWLRVPAARLDFDPGDGSWTLHCFDPESRAMPYDTWEPDFVQPTSVAAILSELDADPTEIFWG